LPGCIVEVLGFGIPSACLGFTKEHEHEGFLPSIAPYPAIGFKTASTLLSGLELALSQSSQMSDAAGLLPFSRTFPEPVAPAIKWPDISRRISCAYPLIPAELPHFFVALDTLKFIGFLEVCCLERTAKQKRRNTYNT
jgi:hypothetical protein